MRNKAANAGSRPVVAVLVYEGVSTFELGVACQVFGDDQWMERQDWYELVVCAPRPGPVAAEGGIRVEATSDLAALERATTVVALPTERWEQIPETVFAGLRRAHRRGCRIASFCTGAFVLAAAGLLDGRRATTHWSECAELAERFPAVTVDPDVLYVDEGAILTSAGSAASIDLSLHMVRRDFGSEMATRLARQLVVPPQRDGGQAQFIESPLPSGGEGDLFAATLAWMEGHREGEVTVAELAERSAMSPRTFARRFAATTGTTPYQWLLRQRVQMAQRLLESTDHTVEQVASESGFGTAANLRKHFGRVVRTSPQAYRAAFRDRSEDPTPDR
jgi:AraC family transcriptional regulator, transcriptional activator FtrA